MMLDDFLRGSFWRSPRLLKLPEPPFAVEDAIMRGFEKQR